MGMLQRLVRRQADAHGVRDGELTLIGRVDDTLHVAARHVLADDEWLLRLVFAHVEDGDDMRVAAQPAQSRRLALNTGATVGVEARRLDQRESDVAVEAGVVRAVDDLAGALAEQFLDLVAPGDEGRGEGYGLGGGGGGGGGSS